MSSIIGLAVLHVDIHELVSVKKKEYSGVPQFSSLSNVVKCTLLLDISSGSIYVNDQEVCMCILAFKRNKK